MVIIYKVMSREEDENQKNELEVTGTAVYWRLWAKTSPDGASWHALPCHLLDVAATASTLYDRLPNAIRTLVEQWFNDPLEARNTTILLAALHDVGKCNRFFQGKVSEFRVRLNDMGVNDELEPKKHGQATNALLAKWLIDKHSWEVLVARSISSGVGGHHGTFYRDSDLVKLALLETPWFDYATQLMDDIATVLLDSETLPMPVVNNGYLAWLSGFTTVADWLGSHSSMTVWQNEPVSLKEYLGDAQKRANQLFDELNLSWPEITDTRSPEELVPAGVELNGMQQLAAELAKNDFGLAIIEGPTGEGKTEAAFIMAEKFRANGQGLYFALPTMATANGVYDRVTRFLEVEESQQTRAPRLLHSLAWLQKEEFRSIGNHYDTESAGIAEDWFAASKRGLLYPYGTGTIDQLLMSSLKVKHFFVRLFGLAGKVVVLDEIHAYDVYMNSLIEVVLAWLKVLNCRVILLSATLPKSKRQALLAAWGCTEDSNPTYPSISIVRKDGSLASSTFTVRPRKKLTIAYAHQINGMDGEAQFKDFVTQISANNATGAIVMNTVKGAQKTFDELRAMLHDSKCELLLFHARFTVEDRQHIEKKVLERFGKGRPTGLPAILVATQVVEQSLDLDFDFMISELAPVDLLIQRAGRLHRHKRNTHGSLIDPELADQRKDPTLHVIVPYPDDEIDIKVEGQVYEPLILVRTHLLLENMIIISKPTDVADAIAKVYDDDPDWENTVKNSRKLARYFDQQTLKDSVRRLTAEHVSIIVPDADKIVTFERNIEVYDDEPDIQIGNASTRLAELPSIKLVLQYFGEPYPSGPYRLPLLKTLAQRTITVSAGHTIISELKSLGPGDQWNRHKTLSHCTLAELDESGTFETVSYIFVYNATSGLTWRKKDG